MKERIKKCWRNKKGFTMVELIVILIILAILAAILVPAFTGWIDKAKEKKYLLECRSCVSAAQGLASEAYGKQDFATWSSTDNATDRWEEIAALADVAGTGEVTEDTYDAAAQITKLVYTRDGVSITYENGVYSFGEDSLGGTEEPGESESSEVGSETGGSDEEPIPPSPGSSGISYNPESGTFSGVYGTMTALLEYVQGLGASSWNGNSGNASGLDKELLKSKVGDGLKWGDDFKAHKGAGENQYAVAFNAEVGAGGSNDDKYIFWIFSDGDSVTVYRTQGKSSVDNGTLRGYWKAEDGLAYLKDKTNGEAIVISQGQ